jgi:hypothetical protein
MPPGRQPGGIFCGAVPVSVLSSFRFSLIATLLGTALAGQAAPAAPAAPTQVAFDTTPRAGQHQRQTIDLKAVMAMRLEAGADATDEQRAKIAQAAERMAQMGAMKMNMQMQQTMKVGAPDAAGWLPLTMAVATKAATIEVGGRSVPLPNAQASDMSFTARFNPQDFGFEVQQLEGLSPQMAEVMRSRGIAAIGEALQLYKALAQKPMKVGDSVDVPLTMALPMPLPGGAGAMQGLVRYTLARVDRGVAHFDLGLELKMDVDTPVPAPAAASAPQGAEAPAPQSLKMQITGSGKGSSSLRLSDRLPLANRMAMTMKMVMNGPDNGRMFMDMDMTMQSRGESLAKPAAVKKKP